jgi:hypothetical protein
VAAIGGDPRYMDAKIDVRNLAIWPNALRFGNLAHRHGRA